MKLKTKIFLVMSAVFLVFIAFVWFYAHALSEAMNEQWGNRYIQKQIVFDKYRTLFPIMQEVALVQKLAHEPAVLAMAEDEKSAVVREKGLRTLEHYRPLFQDHSYFAAFSPSGHYYFNDRNNQFMGRQIRYTLSPVLAQDRWFYETIVKNEPYQINVNRDVVLHVDKVWINYVLHNAQGKAIGIIGTGFDIGTFLKQSVGVKQEGVSNFFVDQQGSIQLIKDTQMIDYASITKKDGTHKTIELIFTHPTDIEAIHRAMGRLQRGHNPNAVETLWVNEGKNKKLLGIAYQREIGWFSMTLFDAKELILVNDNHIFATFTLLFLLTLGVVGYTVNRLILEPIYRLKKRMAWAETQAMYEEDDRLIGTGEIAELSQRFNDLIHEIQEHHATLEEKIRERTNELMVSKVKLQSLAFYDTLTNLPNRRLLNDRLLQAQRTSKRTGRYGAVLFLDLDNFKPLNDTYGHSTGDVLLIQVAQRIQHAIRESDTVARFGGDEFIVLLSELSTAHEESILQATMIAEKIRHTLSMPYFLTIMTKDQEKKKVEHHCSASIGFSLFFDHANTQDEILNQADNAMYMAKEQGRNRVYLLA